MHDIARAYGLYVAALKRIQDAVDREDLGDILALSTDLRSLPDGERFAVAFAIEDAVARRHRSPGEFQAALEALSRDPLGDGSRHPS